jgi:hypothetical protein
MPTIELTDEQAEELRDVLVYESDRLTFAVKDADPFDDDAIATLHTVSVLSDILELLEIA